MADLLSLFRTNNLKHAWEFDAGAAIWRIFFASPNKIIGESRDESAKSTNYFCIDAQTGLPIWKNVSLNEPWWVGIEAVNDRWMILHGYTRLDMPEHKGVYKLEIESGKVLWQNNDLAFWFMDDEDIYAQKYLFEKRIGYKLDNNTGEILVEYTDDLDVLHNKRMNAIDDKNNDQNDLLFPEIYNSKNADLLVSGVVASIEEKALKEWIEYYYRSGILLLSYYRVKRNDSSQLLDMVLRVYDPGKRKMIYEEVVEKELSAPSHDTFIIKIPFVYFIKDRCKLTALRPWKS